MAIKAVWKINTGVRVYEPGEVITGLSSAEEERLISMGAAVLVDGSAETTPVEGADDEQVNALRAVLSGLTKNGMLDFAKRAGIQGVNGTMKNNAILDAILADAKSNGIDLEAFDDGQLVKFAKEVGVELPEEAGREEILDAIEAHFG